MIKGLYLIAIIVFVSQSAFPQKNTLSPKSDPVILSSAGGEYKTSFISLAWTVGEPVVATASSFDGIFTQGFHQPIIFSKTQTPITVKETIKGIQIGIAPNPVHSILTVRIAAITQSRVDMYLSTSDGKKIFHQVCNGTDVTTHINMEPFAAGLYLLHFYNSSGLLKTFEIIKY